MKNIKNRVRSPREKKMKKYLMHSASYVPGGNAAANLKKVPNNPSSITTAQQLLAQQQQGNIVNLPINGNGSLPQNATGLGLNVGVGVGVGVNVNVFPNIPITQTLQTVGVSTTTASQAVSAAQQALQDMQYSTQATQAALDRANQITTTLSRLTPTDRLLDG